MAGLKSFLKPDFGQNLEELDSIASQQLPPDVSGLEFFGDAAYNGMKDNLFSTGIHYGINKFQQALGMSTKLSPDNLREVYPNIPEDMHKGGMTAYQAEVISDRLQRQQDMQSYQEILATNTGGKFSPTAYAGYEMLELAGSLGGGLIDPLNVAMGAVGSIATKGLATTAPLVQRAMPMLYKSIASSRLSSNVIREMSENFIGDLAVTYPANRLAFDEFNRQESDVGQMFVESLATGAVFGGVRSFSNSGRLADKTAKTQMSSAGDRINSAVNPDSMNTAVTAEAIKAAAVHGDPNVRSSINKEIAKRVFGKNETASPNMDTTQTGTFYGAYEANTMTNGYVGRRYGDTHVFISSQDGINRMIDITSKDSSYRVMSHEPRGKILDLESSRALDFADILDIIDEEMPHAEWSKITEKFGDETTLAQVFDEVAKFNEDSGPSGFDYVEMFDQINKRFAEQGIDGTRYLEPDGGHTVLSMFGDKLDETALNEIETKNGTGNLEATDLNISPREDITVTDLNGKEIESVSKVDYDHMYDHDPEIAAEIKRLNEVTDLDVQELVRAPDVELINQDILTDIDTSIKLDETKTLELEQLKKALDEAKVEADNRAPEKISEIAKATENCLRK